VQVRTPSARTLKRYGLSPEAWRGILKGQGGVCAVCGTVPKSGGLVIDHEHTRGWAKLPPEKRRLYVRGLLCSYDNFRWLRKGATTQRLRAAADYLERYEKTRSK
jgi:hypothetical protein